jgi:hypothetical protein
MFLSHNVSHSLYSTEITSSFPTLRESNNRTVCYHYDRRDVLPTHSARRNNTYKQNSHRAMKFLGIFYKVDLLERLAVVNNLKG